MQLLFENTFSSIACIGSCWPPLAHLRGRVRRKPSQVSYDRQPTTEQEQWGQLIHAIGARQNRTAFAELFVYFAPQIKGFMLRSGASDAIAEELAQETMLAVWRKAALFNPASGSAAAWIFTIFRNLRIDAHRRERRGGAVRVSDVEIEF